LRKPNRAPSACSAAAPPRSSPAQTPSTNVKRVADPVDVEPRVERPQPLGIDVPGSLQEVRGLAVDHHPDVDELLAFGSRYAAEHDVLVRHVRHAAPPAR